MGKTSLRRAMFLEALALLAISNVVNADMVVVVNPNNPVTSLTAQEINEIYLKKSITFPNGKEVQPYDVVPGTDLNKKFVDIILKRTQSQVKAYWSRKIFTGEGVPPEILEDETEVKQMISMNETAIGYIDSSVVDSSVKVVFKE